MKLSKRPTDQALERTVAALTRCNEKTAPYGLRLTPEEMNQLARQRFTALDQTGRVEFGDGVLETLVAAFQDSPYLHQGAYAETVGALQDLFYHFKNESMDRLTDEILLQAMRVSFDRAGGSLDYLGGTALEDLCRWARSPESSMRVEIREDEEEGKDGE